MLHTKNEGYQTLLYRLIIAIFINTYITYKTKLYYIV